MGNHSRQDPLPKQGLDGPSPAHTAGKGTVPELPPGTLCPSPHPASLHSLPPLVGLTALEQLPPLSQPLQQSAIGIVLLQVWA